MIFAKERQVSKEEINAFLGSNTVYTGTLTFQGAVRIDGTYSGDIHSDGALIVGKDAQIQGTLEVGELILGGTFSGEVRAKRRVVIHKTGVLSGSLNTPALVVEEGGTLDGDVHMGSRLPGSGAASS
jgi:cytoskeletal protein CcmA (bactofilin family)